MIFLFQIDRLMELYFKYQRRVQDADVKIERELEVSFTVCLYVQTSPKEKLIHFLWVYSYDSPSKLKKMFDCDALRDLVPFVRFKKREKHPWRSVNFGKVAGWSQQLY